LWKYVWSPISLTALLSPKTNCYDANLNNDCFTVMHCLKILFLRLLFMWVRSNRRLPEQKEIKVNL
jgi:hypothetical protein